MIEMLLVIAVAAILAGAILVSVSQQKENAQATKMLTELSSSIQPMIMCVADGGDLIAPNGGGDICSEGSGYGQWPDTGENGFNDYAYHYSSDYSDWHIYTDTGDVRICCNSAMKSCRKIDSGDICNDDTPN